MSWDTHPSDMGLLHRPMSKYIWSDQDLAKLKQLILERDKIVIFPHTGPDGDALGSTLAWAGLLRSAHPGASVHVISPDPVESYLAWLPALDELVIFPLEEERSLQLIAEADLIFHLDHNQISRLRYPRLVEAATSTQAPRVLIDHHLYPETGFDLTFSYADASATSELIHALALALGWRSAITPDLATLLLTGIITDTGRFMYSHLSPELFVTTSDLLALGANYPHVIDRLSYHNPEVQIRLQGYVLDQKLELYPELRAACITLTQEELRRFGASKGDTEGLVNIPLTIEGIDCCCFIREDKTQIKLSFRSTGDFPVNRIASEGFGGGGHLNAAGAEHQGTIEEAKNIYLCQLRRFNDSTGSTCS